jgi:serine/threonine protein kinase
MLSDDEIGNELRAVEKFGRTANDHLVAVLHHGKLSDSPYYFIDMELCNMDLNQYIYKVRSDGGLRFQNSLPVRVDVNDIWKIMSDISDGVAFIHNHMEIHRDIKPTNSILLLFLFLMDSFVFRRTEGVEDCGFRILDRDIVEDDLVD